LHISFESLRGEQSAADLGQHHVEGEVDARVQRVLADDQSVLGCEDDSAEALDVLFALLDNFFLACIDRLLTLLKGVVLDADLVVVAQPSLH